MSTTTIITIIIIVIVFIVLVISKDSNFGINLKRVYCPKCNEKQPIVRKPNGQRQALYGGHTCRKCGTEMDKYGDIILDSWS
jgi:ssDNA-binding Zn-finger/Zn-ribbon topoisomerase 1